MMLKHFYNILMLYIDFKQYFKYIQLFTALYVSVYCLAVQRKHEFSVRCFKLIWKVGKVGKLGKVGKVGKVGMEGKVDKVGGEGLIMPTWNQL